MNTPHIHIPPGVADALPPTEWPWLWILIIIIVVILAVLIISWTTQRSIRAMAGAAQQMVTAARAVPEGSRSVSGLTALGRAELEWEPGAFTIALRSRFAGGEGAADEATRNADRFAQELFSMGLSETDIEQDEASLDGDGSSGSIDMRVSLLTGAEMRATKILEAGIAFGFSESREAGREEISFADASEMAGRAAIDDAMANTSVLLQGLKIDRAGLKVVSAGIRSEPGEGRIVRVAEFLWDGDR